MSVPESFYARTGGGDFSGLAGADRAGAAGHGGAPPASPPPPRSLRICYTSALHVIGFGESGAVSRVLLPFKISQPATNATASVSFVGHTKVFEVSNDFKGTGMGSAVLSTSRCPDNLSAVLSIVHQVFFVPWAALWLVSAVMTVRRAMQR